MATKRTSVTHGHKPFASRSGSNGGIGNGRGGNGSNGRGRPKRRKKQNPFFRFVNFFLTTVVLLVLFGAAIIAAMVLNIVKTMPSTVAAIENYKPAGRTLIYSSDGTLLANLFQQNRQTVTIDNIPPMMQNATVAIEDNRFWTNKYGFDIRGIGRSIVADMRHRKAKEGASTIAQQLVRNLGIGGVTREKTFQRKVREIIYANQIERNYSKQQILEMYLNAVYYGSGAYGVQAAAEVYFGKPVDKIDIAQSAMIAGMPQSPSQYSPYVNKQAALNRRNQVLAAMLKYGYINSDQYASALAEPIVLAFPKPPSNGSKTYHANYFVDYVINYLTANYGSDYIYQGGIKVYTTLNYRMQQAAETAVTQHIADMRYTGATDAAMVAMEPQTGYIKAMVGGVDYTKSQFNIAAYGRRQPGSSFKPIIYTGAIDSGIITEKTRILDEPIRLPGANGSVWAPKNDDGVWHGWVTATWAVADSINVPAVKVLEKLGVSSAIHYAQIMGVRSPLAPYLTLALGASGCTPLEMADVYATIDNKGRRPTPTPIMQITDDSGNVIQSTTPKLETTSISQDACTQMTDMLRAVVTGGTASGTFRDNNPPDACGKTGTTQNHNDVWFDGFTKDMVCTVWAGHPALDPKTRKAIYGLPMTREAFGATVCAPIWKQFMITAEVIEQQQRAREAKRNKPKPAVVPAKPQADDSNSGMGDNSGDQTDTTEHLQSPQATDNSTQSGDAIPGPTAAPVSSGNMTSVWVDNNTGQPTAPNAPNSHQETFAKGYAPQTPTQTQPDNGRVSSESDYGGNASSSVPTSSPGTDAPASSRTVSVTICAESGLLATKWCPETITETFAVGDQPRRYCNIHSPPPGER